jgi:hypothetical protein
MVLLACLRDGVDAGVGQFVRVDILVHYSCADSVFLSLSGHTDVITARDCVNYVNRLQYPSNDSNPLFALFCGTAGMRAGLGLGGVQEVLHCLTMRGRLWACCTHGRCVSRR